MTAAVLQWAALDGRLWCSPCGKNPLRRILETEEEPKESKKVSFSMLALSRYPAVALLAWCLLCLESEGGLRRRNTCGNQGWTFIVCDKVEVYHGWPSLTAQQVGHKVVRWHPPFFCRRHQQRKALRMLKKPRYRLRHVSTAGAGRTGEDLWSDPLQCFCFALLTIRGNEGQAQVSS